MINLNGQFFSRETPVVFSTNRAFRYGDGLFESIRVFGGKMPFFDRHWQRLNAGMAVLKFEIPAHFTAAFFQNEISKLTENQGNWRIRLTVFRAGGGLYTPERNDPEFLIEATPQGSRQFEINAEGLTIGIYPETCLPCDPKTSKPQNPKTPKPQNRKTWNFKTGNSLPFVLAAIFKKEKNWDDCLLLNTAGRIACGGSSNVFLVKNGELLTPPLSEGCVAGTMRSVVLDVCKDLKIKVLEAPFPPEDLPQADEIFLTNAIQGIRWAGKVEGIENRMVKNIAVKITTALAATMNRLLSV